MLLQTNSYVVPKEKRAEHSRLLRKFRQALARIGCDSLEVYEQVGANWSNGETTGRFVQIMRFRDRKHQLAVQAAERNDPVAQQLIQEFCQLINFPYQQQQGLFAVGFYTSALPVAPTRAEVSAPPAAPATEDVQQGQQAETIVDAEQSTETAQAAVEEEHSANGQNIDSAEHHADELQREPTHDQAADEVDLLSEDDVLDHLNEVDEPRKHA
jgi:hypothetical protein